MMPRVSDDSESAGQRPFSGPAPDHGVGLGHPLKVEATRNDLYQSTNPPFVIYCGGGIRPLSDGFAYRQAVFQTD
jgi:hypothetical protein